MAINATLAKIMNPAHPSRSRDNAVFDIKSGVALGEIASSFFAACAVVRENLCRYIRWRRCEGLSRLLIDSISLVRPPKLTVLHVKLPMAYFSNALGAEQPVPRRQ